MLRNLANRSFRGISRVSSLQRSFHPSPSFFEAAASTTHFNATNIHHPLKAKLADQMSEIELANKFGRLQNHIWTLEELHDKTTNVYKHQPATFSDHLMRSLMSAMYHSFNFLTGYKKVNPTVSSIEWRLIVLESVAGVPGKTFAKGRSFS